MNISSIVIFISPLFLAILACVLLKRHSILWLEVFAVIIFLTAMVYGVIFWLSVKDTLILKMIGAVSVVQFLGLLLFPILSEAYYQQSFIKSFFFDNHSRLEQLAKDIRKSRWLSSLSVFLYYLISFDIIFYSIHFMEGISQILWATGFSIAITIKTAITWKPSLD